MLLTFGLVTALCFRHWLPLALDIISAHASQACVYRVFSVCGDITAGKRKRLNKNLFSWVFPASEQQILLTADKMTS